MLRSSQIVKLLEERFENVVKTSDNAKVISFQVKDEYGSTSGTLTLTGASDWHIYVDNFPGQKMYFNTNLPFSSIEQFQNDIERTGLNLILKPSTKEDAKTYTTRAAESLEGIALREFGDASRWKEIRDLNSDSYPDMNRFEYYPVGSVINIPNQ